MTSRRFALAGLRAAMLVAIAASAALTTEYRSLEPSFCGVNSGCAALRRTGLAQLWGAGITLPELGLFAFALVFALSLTRAVRAAALLAVVGGLGGLALLVSQAIVLQQFCWLCIAADLAAIAAAAAGAIYLSAQARSEAGDPAAVSAEPLSLGRWAALAIVAAIAPPLWTLAKPAPDVHASVRALYRPNKINVIEFADFECPFCRNLHQRLKPLLAPYGDRVNFVRLNVPLARHPQARDAARAAICAEPSGKADAFADFLFSAEDLGKERITAEAVRLGLDRAAFERCLAAPETEQRIERETKILHDAGMEGLPTTYIGASRIVGAQPDSTFEDALERAAQGRGDRGVPLWLYLLGVLTITALIVFAGRNPSAPRAARSAPSRAE